MEEACVGYCKGRFLQLFLCLLVTGISPVLSQDVLACGGFIKSEIAIDFSRVEVKLYTKQGSLKYQTDCAPNNGYYLIPVYDKGDYVLKVEPPEGWLFDPASVSLRIDGSKDDCSQSKDINFQFKGFSIYGQIVSRGRTDGPSNISVELSPVAASSKQQSAVLQKSSTDTKGNFHFSNVQPGNYSVSASPVLSLLFERRSMVVHVSSDNARLAEPLVVSGYGLSGRVLGADDGEPVKGVRFILFGTKASEELRPLQCEPGLPPGFDLKEVVASKLTTPVAPLCHVEAMSDGRFVFPAVVPGRYVVVPFYRNQNIKFDVVPAQWEVEVGHASVVLQKEFKVEGFSVNGRVTTSPGGKGVAGAHVILNGKKLAETKEDGVYHLENMRAGNYEIQIVAEKMQFGTSTVKINPNVPDLPDIVASAFEVCGSLEGDGNTKKAAWFVAFKKTSITGDSELAVQSDAQGRFCTWLPSGAYEAFVDGRRTAERSPTTTTKVVFKPSVFSFVVQDAPVTNVKFHQFKSKVEGRVDCLENCDKSVQVLLRSTEVGSQAGNQRLASVSRGKFVFADVLPGSYELQISNDGWCWQDRVQLVSVVDQDVDHLTFKHTGFLLTVLSTHATTLRYMSEAIGDDSSKKEGENKKIGSKMAEKKSGTKSGELSINKGSNKICLEQPGVYSLKPVGCHIFDSDQYVFDTTNPTVLTLEANRHLLSGTVLSDHNVSDIRISIRVVEDVTQHNGEEAILGPLTAKRRVQQGDYEYAFTYWAIPHKTIDLQPRSDELLFYPDKEKMTVVDDCMPNAVQFQGKKGLFLNGVVHPPLAGVRITVTAQDGSMKPVLLETDANGRYRVGPLHGHTKYDIDAKKHGYILSQGKEWGHFSAFKLAEIPVRVVDEQGRPLAGVILSLSGGTDYRQNSLSQEDGRMVFSGLGPGQYFLRAMMKEFQFDPPSKMVDVVEGGTVDVLLTGKRVAFSCFGAVTSLTGDSESGVVIEAVGKDACAMLQEEVTTEDDGTFRLRGLRPNCTYEVRLKKASDVNAHIERSTPKFRLVHVTDTDVHRISLIVFRPLRTMDISGNVITAKEFLGSLKVRLSSENGADRTHSLGESTFFQFLSLSMDNSLHTVSLESTLSRNAYDYVLPTEVLFKANDSYRHFTFVFEPRPNGGDHDATPGSYLALPLAILIFLIVTNHSRLLPLCVKAAELILSFSGPAAARNYEGPSASIGGSAANSSGSLGSTYDVAVAPVKKKVKPRKVQ